MKRGGSKLLNSNRLFKLGLTLKMLSTGFSTQEHKNQVSVRCGVCYQTIRQPGSPCGTILLYVQDPLSLQQRKGTERRLVYASVTTGGASLQSSTDRGRQKRKICVTDSQYRYASFQYRFIAAGCANRQMICAARHLAAEILEAPVHHLKKQMPPFLSLNAETVFFCSLISNGL